MCVCGESEDISGVKCTTTAETRAFPPALVLAPSAYSTTHTCLYSHSEHKAFTISRLLHIQMPGAEHGNRNVRERMPPRLLALCILTLCVYMHVMYAHWCMLVCFQVWFVSIFYILSLPRSHFETLQVSVSGYQLLSSAAPRDSVIDGQMASWFGMKVTVGTEG